MQFAGGGLLVGYEFFEQRAGFVDEVVRELQRAVVLCNRVFHRCTGQGGQIAQPLFASAADEVGVAGPVAAGRFAEHQPGPLVVEVAAPTEQRTLQIVIVDTVPVAVGAAVPQDLLHPGEQSRRYERFVTARVDLALPDDVARVVRVAQHFVKLRGGYRLLDWPAARGAAGEPEIGHRGCEVLDGVVAGRVEFPRLDHQGSAFLVDLDGVDLASFDEDAGIDVAEFGAPAGAAVHRLVQHLDTDVLAGQLVLSVVEDVGDGGHHLGVDALAEILSGRDQFDAHHVELPCGHRGVDVVAERPRTRVHDDVLDLRVLLQEGHHLLKLAPLLDRLSRDARLDELPDDLGRDRLGATVDDLALGRNRIPVRVDIDRCVELLLVRNPQVGDCFKNSPGLHESSSASWDCLASAMRARLSLRRSGGSRCSLSTMR
nr:hypothetical protein [Nocardia transvalensis]